MKNNRFFSQEYVDDYNNKKIFPKIHDDIIVLIDNFSRAKRALDLGACTFLLPARLVEQLGFELCVGVEGNKNYVEKSISHDKVIKANFYVNFDTLDELQKLIIDNEIKLITARRVLPEISKDSLYIIHALAKVLYYAGIEEIALEGRVKTKNATALLSSVDGEVKALKGYFEVQRAYKNCRLLKRMYNL